MRPWRARIAWTDLPVLLGYGVALGLMNLCFYLALRTVPLGVTVALWSSPDRSGVAVAGSRRPR